MRCVAFTSRAFTLIELLIVVLIVAVLIAIVMPAVGSARAAARQVVSSSNLAQLGRAHLAYCGEQRGNFVNPFDPAFATDPSNPAVDPSTPGMRDWMVYKDPRTHQQWSSTWTILGHAEAFSWIAASLLAANISPGDYLPEYIMSPSDRHVRDRMRAVRTQAPAATTYREEFHVQWIDSSYWYPPVFWLDAGRYAGPERPVVGRSLQDARAYWRRNRQDSVTWPSMKALMFERFDFSRPTRLTGFEDERVRAHPMFCNPDAAPQTVFVDGSVGRASVGAMAAASEPGKAGEDELAPSGVFAPETWYLERFRDAKNLSNMAQDPIENGDAIGGFSRTMAWPGYLFATRNGIKGRDVVNRTGR